MEDRTAGASRKWIKRIWATLVGLIGCGCFWLYFNGLNRLFILMEDEGTESWTVNAGPFGIPACVAFLAILFIIAVSLITNAIYLLVPALKPTTRAEL